jgi:cell division protease FtsH
LDQVRLSLGGRAAEEIVFGHDEVTAGASGDIRYVADLAREMVTRYGMSELGLLALEGEDDLYMNRGALSRTEYSEEVAVKIDRQIRQIVQQCHQDALKLLRQYRPVMDQLVDMLLEQETIDGEEFRQILEAFEAERKQLTLQTVGKTL